MTPVQHQRLGPSSTSSERVRVTSTFVPSEKTPLIDILLSRAIFGESPSKLATTSYHSRNTSPSKAKRDKKASKPQESPSAEPGDNDSGMGTKKKVGTTRKGGGRAKTTQDDDDPEPASPT
ncbi:hypothetical protein M405DRAFT_931550 [Rhizopogon salebrosus TDB-379]|nr:hypothetical protein M405DRAFT_931550 [Rhizopogon salebrosus TDB-379]